MSVAASGRKLIKKIKKVNLLWLLKRIPNKGVRNYLIPRIYYYFHLKPNEIMMDISSKCNALCPFCPKTLQKINGVHMEPEIFYKAVDDAAALGIRNCRLYSTGEPLLHPHIDGFMAYLKDKGFAIMVSTNGQYLDKHFESMGLADEIKVSIEGWDKESYEYYRRNCDFDRVHENLIRFKEFLKGKDSRPVVTVGLMMLKETDVKAFYEAWQDKCDQIAVWPTGYVHDWDENKKIKYLSFDDDQRLKENIFHYKFDEKKSKYCGYHFTSVVVSAKGNAVICCCDYRDNIAYGNIREKSFNDIINDSRRRDGQRQFIRQTFDVCKGCPAFLTLDEESQEIYNRKLASCPTK